MLAIIILIKTTQASRVRGATLVASAGKESTCNAGDSGLISGLGRSAGEGIGYPIQYSWVSHVAQLVKNPRLPLELFMGFQDPCQTVCGICKFFQTMHGGVSDPSFFSSSTGLPSKRCPGIGFL